MAEEAGNATLVGDNRIHSNGESKKDGCSDDMPSAKGKSVIRREYEQTLARVRVSRT